MARTTGSDNKKKGTRVAEGPRGKGFARSLGESLGLLVRPLVPLTVLIVAYAGLSYALWSPLNGESNISAQARLTDHAVRQAILSNPCPDWISLQDFKQIAADGAATAVGHSVFEMGLSRKLAEAYARNSWVERVVAVRLRYPARIELEIEFRKPFARIERGAVLDRQGVGLNLSSDNPIVRKLPMFTGIAQRNVSLGKMSTEKTVIDALDLLGVVRDALAQAPGALKVSSVEQKDGRWKVATVRGPTILWGTFSDDPPIDEPRTHEKATLLRRRLCESKDPSILEYVKVYIAQAPVMPRAPGSRSEIPAASDLRSH